MNFLKTNWFEIIYVRKLAYVLVILFVFLGIAAYLGQMLPKIMADLFESYDNKELFLEKLQLLGFVFVGEYLNRVLYQLSINKYVQYVILQTRNYCYQNWIKSYEIQKSGAKNKEYPLGEILSRIMNDTEAIRELVTSGTFGIFIDSFFIISCLISFYRIDSFSGGSLIIAEVLAVIILIFGSRYMATAFYKVRKEIGILSRSVADVTAGLFQSFFQDHHNYGGKTVRKKFSSFLHEQLKANIYDAAYYSTAESLYPLLLAFVGLVFSYSPLVQGAVVVAIIDLIQRSIDPIKDITGKISNIQRAYTGMIRINEFTSYLQEGFQADVNRKFNLFNLDLLHVRVGRFSYGGGYEKERENVFEIKNIDIKAKSGELVGIIGLSGSGKSTLLKIMSCDLLAQDGFIVLSRKSGNEDIKFDFKDPKTMTNYREQVSLVSQESHVFSESLRFNIMMENVDHDSEKAKSFYKFWDMVNDEIDYVRNWNVNPESELSPKNLSLGQKQLLSALRACYLRKPIALFDEISSGLDSDLELALRKLLLLIQQHSLTVIVAHRLETIVKADQIIVMENGVMTQRGNHEELLKQSEVYQRFISLLN